MPNLENLRKQAKLYRALASRRLLPGRRADQGRRAAFQDLTGPPDPGRPASSSATHRSWWLANPGSKAGRRSRQECKPCPKPPTAVAAKPELTEVEAELFVADIKASCAFFTSKLGFDVVFTYGEPPFYGQVKRDNARLNLRLVCEPVFVGDIREREQLLAGLDDAGQRRRDHASSFVQYQSAGVGFPADPEAGAVGRAHLRRARSRRQPAAVRRGLLRRAHTASWSSTASFRLAQRSERAGRSRSGRLEPEDVHDEGLDRRGCGARRARLAGRLSGSVPTQASAQPSSRPSAKPASSRRSAMPWRCNAGVTPTSSM